MIADDIRRAGPYTTNGVQTVFAFGFKVFAASDLLVTSSEGGVNTELAIGTDYSVTLNADQDTTPGGTVTIDPALNGPSLIITGDLAIEQPTVFTNTGGFYPRVLNDALDRVTIYLQQLYETITRAIVAPIGTSITANSVVTTDGGGNVAFTPLADFATEAAIAAEQSTKEDIWAGNVSGKYVASATLAEAAEPQTVASAATITLDCAAGFSFNITLDHNTTLANMLNAVPGYSCGTIKITQGTTGGTMSYGSKWVTGGGAQLLSVGAGKKDIISYQVRSSTEIYYSIDKDVKTV
jgi:hypothetical protein